MNRKTDTDLVVSPREASHKKRFSRRFKIVMTIFLLLIISGAGFFGWFGVNGSGLPMASVTSFHVSNGEPIEFLIGPDRHLWFTYSLLQPPGIGIWQVGSLTLDGHRTSIHLTVPAGFDHYEGVENLSAGVDGTMWGIGTLHPSSQGAENLKGVIWRIEPGTGKVTVYPDPVANLVAGRDGFLWYTEWISPGGSKGYVETINRWNPQTREVKRYATPFSENGGTLELERLVQGPNGDFWFLEKHFAQNFAQNGDTAFYLERFHPQTGTFSSVLLPQLPHAVESQVDSPIAREGPLLLPVPDGGAWVLQEMTQKLPHSLGPAFTLLEYVSPTGQVTKMFAPDQGFIKGIAPASGNNLWVVYDAIYHWPLAPFITHENRLALVTPAGVFTQLFRLPQGNITELALSINHQLWAVVNNAGPDDRNDQAGFDFERLLLPQ